MAYGAYQQMLELKNPVTDVPSTYAAISGVSQSGREAIRKAQQENPDFYPRTFSEVLDDYDEALSSIFESPVNPVYPSYSAPAVARKNKPIDYFNADLAKHYGMGRSSAYQEALANTSYQRSVADMKAAGLNPAVLFGSGRAQGAGSSVYAPEGGSNSSGFRGRSGSGNNDKLFSGSAYSAIQAIGGLIGLGLTKRPDGFWIGSQTAKGAMGLLDSLWK